MVWLCMTCPLPNVQLPKCRPNVLIRNPVRPNNSDPSPPRSTKGSSASKKNKGFERIVFQPSFYKVYTRAVDYYHHFTISFREWPCTLPILKLLQIHLDDDITWTWFERHTSWQLPGIHHQCPALYHHRKKTPNATHSASPSQSKTVFQVAIAILEFHRKPL